MIFILAFARHFFSRQHLLFVSHLGDYEKAYHIAFGGIEAGRGTIDAVLSFLNSSDNGKFPRREKAPPELRPIIEALIGKDGYPVTESASRDIESPLIAQFRDGLEKDQTLKVSLELKRIKPIFLDSTTGGVIPDAREAEFGLFVHGEATSGNAACRVSWYANMKVIQIIPPVIGKFVLYLREQGFFQANSLKDSNDINKLEDSPVVVTGGKILGPELLKPQAVQGFIDSQGWVFLGGPIPWSLGLSNYAGSEKFQECLLNSRRYIFPIPSPDAFSSHSDARYFSIPEFIQGELRSLDFSEVLIRKPPELAERSSMLHLAGSAGNPAPTLVLGNVSRKWALIQGLFNSKSQRILNFPFLDSVAFLGNDWPGNFTGTEIQRIRENFGNSFDNYSERMSDILEEDYNAGILSAIDFSAFDAASILFPTDLKKFPGIQLPNPSSLIDAGGTAAIIWQRVMPQNCTIRNDSGKPVFENGNLDNFPDLSFLLKKSGPVFPDWATFKKKIPRDDSGRIVHPGCVVISSGIAISDPVVISGGGMILVKGGITIKSKIESSPDEPLSLIALDGDIIVETDENIAAGLIALNGKLRFGRSCKIFGLCAGRELQLEHGKAFAERVISYNSSFDPTCTSNYQKNYRFMVWEKGVTFVH